MDDQAMEMLVDQLATLRQIIVEREGEDVADQFEVGPFILTVNIEGSNYIDPEDDATQYLVTRIQVEKGPQGMEQLMGALIEQGSLQGEGDAEGFAIKGDDDVVTILAEIEAACEQAYRHWHWLDKPRQI